MKTFTKEKVWEPQGQALMKYHEGNTDAMLTVYSLDGKQDIPVEIYFRGWEEFPEIEQYALSLCRGKTLDIGAGSGSHALALQEMGIDVTALDISALSVEVMRGRGVKNVLQGDIFDFDLSNFDTLVMFMNGIGFVHDLHGLELFLNKAKEIIHPDGQLIFDSTDLKVENPNRPFLFEYFGIVKYRLEFEKKKGAPFKWLFVDPVTLHQYCKKTGWHCQVVYDDMDGQYLARLRLL